MSALRNTVAFILAACSAFAVVFAGPAMGMDPGVWIVCAGLLGGALSGLIADV